MPKQKKRKPPMRKTSVLDQAQPGDVIVKWWKHKGCGGEVHFAEGGFLCLKCRMLGRLGVETPDHLKTKEDVMLYMMDHSMEVDLVDAIKAGDDVTPIAWQKIPRA